jgi:hypothetical protein
MFVFAKPTDPVDTVYTLGAGNALVIKTTKPFRKGDIFQFTPQKSQTSDSLATKELLNVKVVPNPYLSASSLEPPLDPGVTVGRKRKIDFIHVPRDAKINIFTARGDHVIALQQDNSIDNGTVSWNLKTKENLDVAFGVYFYVVESAWGSKTGKIAIIK